jgi:hypothetical protein
LIKSIEGGKSMKRTLATLLMGVGIGCRTFVTDQTVSPQPRSATNTVVVKANVNADFLVVDSTIKAFVSSAGATYPMKGNGRGVWYCDVPVTCADPMMYRIFVTARYIAVPLPLPLPTETTYAPPVGDANLSVQHTTPLIIGPGVIACETGTAGCTKNASIKNVTAASNLVVTGVTIGQCPAPCVDSNGVPRTGDTTGNAFVASPQSAVPVTLMCGQELQIAVTAFRYGGYTNHFGSMVITYTSDGGSSSATLILTAYVFPPL